LTRKAIALLSGRDGAVSQWNPTFAGVALDLEVGIELCWPRSPQQKGSVQLLRAGWLCVSSKLSSAGLPVDSGSAPGT
jgi:hypothetical protein